MHEYPGLKEREFRSWQKGTPPKSSLLPGMEGWLVG